jgi:hypothetical protein
VAQLDDPRAVPLLLPVVLGAGWRETPKVASFHGWDRVNPLEARRRGEVALDLEIDGWQLEAYEFDATRAAAGRFVDVTLRWLPPPWAQLRPSAYLEPLRNGRWRQTIPDRRNLVLDGSFDRHPPGESFPGTVYDWSNWSRATAPNGVLGRAALLQNNADIPRSSFASRPIPIEPEHLYLQAGALRTEGGRASIGRSWQPGGTFGYIAAARQSARWRRFGGVTQPPPGTASAELWLLNVDSTGRALFDDIVFLDLGRIQHGACPPAASVCRPPLATD